MIIAAGFHVPVMPLVEVAGREGAAEFRHKGPIWVNIGTMPPVATSISIVTVAAH